LNQTWQKRKNLSVQRSELAIEVVDAATESDEEYLTRQLVHYNTAQAGSSGRDGIPVEEWKRTHALARERLATWMVTRKDALVDDVNNLRWLRDRWRAAASASCYRTLVVFCLSGCFSKPQYVADDTGSTALAITKARLRAHRPLPLKTRDL